MLQAEEEDEEVKGVSDISDGPEGPSSTDDVTPEATLPMDPRHSCSEALIAETSFTGRYSTPPHPRSLLHTRPFHFPPPPPYPPPPPREDALQDTEAIFCCDAPFKPGSFLVAEEEDEGCGGSGTMTAVSTGDEVEDHHSQDYSYAYNTGPFYPQHPPPQRLQHHHHHHLHHHRLYPPPPPPSPDGRKPGAPRGSAKHHPKDRHTFISTYGVEENIYEEICEARGAFENPYEFAEDSGGGGSVASGGQGLLGGGFLMGRRRKVAPVQDAMDPRATEGLPGGSKDGASRGAVGGEVRPCTVRRITEEEVRRVQMGHRRILGELNLSIEAMLMPNSQSEGEDDEEEEGYGDGFRPSSATTTTTAEEEAELLLSVGPTDELLSPDSGFHSGSSGSVTSSMRAAPDTPRSTRSIPASMPPPTRSRGTPPPPPPLMGGASSHLHLSSHLQQQERPSPMHKSESLDLRRFLGGGSPSPSRRPLLVPPPLPHARRKGLMKVEGQNHPLGIFGKGWRLPGFGGAAKDEPRMRSGSWDDPRLFGGEAAEEEAIGRGSGRRRGGKPSEENGASTPSGKAGSDLLLQSRRLDVLRQVSSETESWGSAESDLSSGDESHDRSGGSPGQLTNGSGGSTSSRTNGNLRSTFNKARTLCDKWRESRGRGKDGGSTLPGAAGGSPSPDSAAAPEGRLSRWFSIRRNQYDVDRGARDHSSTNSSPASSSSPAGLLLHDAPGKMPRLPEEEEASTGSSELNGSSHDHDVTDRPRAMTIAGSTMASPTDVSAAFAPFPTFQRRQQPPALPPPPPGLTSEQIKRRHIVAAIVHSENSYVATLQRLNNDYKKPLEESSPPILSAPKIATLFHRVPEILQCHSLFRIALAESVRNWDKDEALGDVFVASFSKAVVLEIYSDFINNFSIAMDLAKQESKRKSALADFLKVKQISAHDRLSFFGLMVKPVQRFPQFILLLQDLLKHTPHGHHDRMSLQLALTQLESLAEMLNERKREAEQFQAFREMLRHVGGKFAVRPLVSDGGRYLLREDNVTQLEFNQSGMITKSKSRRLLLLNDLLVCVSVAPKSSDDFSSSERLSLKWTHPVTDIEVLDSSASPTLSRLLTAGSSRGGSLKSERSTDGTSSSSTTSSSTISSSSSTNTFGVDDLCQEMNDLMHDYEVLSRVADLVSTLKGSYSEINLENTKRILASIQTSIQQKDEEIAWVDSCCLQIALRGKSGKEEQLTFQTDNPAVKKEWVTELRLAQLALDPNNSPAWDIPEQERRPSTKMPLFVRALPVYKSQHQTEVRCGCFYTIMTTSYGRRRRGGSGVTPKPMSYLWVCTSDGASSHIAVLGQGGTAGVGGGQIGVAAGGVTGGIPGGGLLKDVGAFDLVETKVTAMEFVRGAYGTTGGELSGDTVWMGTDSRRLIVYNAHEPEKQEEVGSGNLPAVAIQIKYHCDQVFAALSDGSVLLFRRGVGGASADEWGLREPQVISLGTEPVSCLLPINVCLYAACGKMVWVLNALTGEIQKSFRVHHEHLGNVHLMAHSGVGLWVSLRNSSTICLYHTETFKHLQDISVAANVARVVSSTGRGSAPVAPGTVHVTALMACRGLLWVGTNVGVALTIPLPRLEGVPIISGRVNISHHAHCGPVTFLLPLGPRPPPQTPPHVQQEETRERRKTAERQPSTESTCSTGSTVQNSRSKPPGSPVAVIRRRPSPRGEGMSVAARRASKTLPRGLGGSVWGASSGSQDCDVYGLYGELMNVRDYEAEGEGGAGVGKGKVTVTRCHSVAAAAYERLRRSDPELAAIPAKVCTLDRRLQMKVGRPRSLDLSDWSVDSRSSSAYTSSGSEESVPVVALPPGPLSQDSGVVSRKTSEGSSTDPSPVAVSSNGSKVAVGRQGVVSSKVVEAPRTIITLMGGRGYVDWRRIRNEKANRGSPGVGWEANTNDAHIVVWEMKL